MQYTYQEITSLVKEPATMTYATHLPGSNDINYQRTLFLQTPTLKIKYDPQLNVIILNQNNQSTLHHTITIEKFYTQLKPTSTFQQIKETDPTSYELENWIITTLTPIPSTEISFITE